MGGRRPTAGQGEFPRAPDAPPRISKEGAGSATAHSGERSRAPARRKPRAHAGRYAHAPANARTAAPSATSARRAPGRADRSTPGSRRSLPCRSWQRRRRKGPSSTLPAGWPPCRRRCRRDRRPNARGIAGIPRNRSDPRSGRSREPPGWSRRPLAGRAAGKNCATARRESRRARRRHPAGPPRNRASSRPPPSSAAVRF